MIQSVPCPCVVSGLGFFAPLSWSWVSQAALRFATWFSIWAAAARSRAGRAALVAARRGLNCVSHGAAALGRGLGGVLLQAQSVGAIDSDVRCVRATRLLEEASRRAAPQTQRSMFSCSTIGCAALQGAVG